ncbi:hypothetical protein VTL71DRAFT_4189 [Oculimacula yallundae]|uniref:Uncharacterized protein n=1 Tax=Oculimacula yallundae TaxID=86028 RepID=A0ABR4C538_9HELO
MAESDDTPFNFLHFYKTQLFTEQASRQAFTLYIYFGIPTATAFRMGFVYLLCLKGIRSGIWVWDGMGWIGWTFIGFGLHICIHTRRMEEMGTLDGLGRLTCAFTFYRGKKGRETGRKELSTAPPLRDLMKKGGDRLDYLGCAYAYTIDSSKSNPIKSRT